MHPEGRVSAEAPEPRAGRLVRLGLVLTSPDPVERAGVATMAERVGIDALWSLGDDEPPASALPALRLPEVDEPWARTVPVVVGRTRAEAVALVELASGFSGFGDPRSDGLFGTLEDCQAQVARLAHDGVRDLRCVLPELPHVHDVLAQLPAIVVGNPATHHPGAARSADPAPPPWAGRRER
jgi:hypothetical protein